MPQSDSDQDSAIPPIFVSVKETARLLNLAPVSVYRLCDSGELVTQYQGKRRLVRFESVKAYADGLPTERESAS